MMSTDHSSDTIKRGGGGGRLHIHMHNLILTIFENNEINLCIDKCMYICIFK